MGIIDKKYVIENREEIIDAILGGKIFVYPTDTIYGIGCNALNEESVRKIRVIKMRNSKPFSVIAPNKGWIKENCVINQNVTKQIDKLPGPYTFILRLKNEEAVSKEVNKGMGTVGVRIPKNWFADIIEEAGVPFVTTSLNITEKDYMTSVDNIDERIKEKVDYIINEGVIAGKPSKVISLVEDREEVLRQ